MEAEARKKSERKAELEAGKERLASYLERFRQAGKSDLAASVENDLKRIDEELSSIG
jgi:cell division septum initiation protein DivIVA